MGAAAAAPRSSAGSCRLSNCHLLICKGGMTASDSPPRGSCHLTLKLIECCITGIGPFIQPLHATSLRVAQKARDIQEGRSAAQTVHSDGQRPSRALGLAGVSKRVPKLRLSSSRRCCRASNRCCRAMTRSFTYLDHGHSLLGRAPQNKTATQTRERRRKTLWSPAAFIRPCCPGKGPPLGGR